MGSAAYFVRSRDPVDDLLAGRARDAGNAAWFRQRGTGELARFAERLARNRTVARAHMEMKAARGHSPVGVLHQIECHFQLQFRGLPGEHFVGTGRSFDPRLARVIACAEIVERLGYYVRLMRHDRSVAAGIDRALVCQEAPVPRSSNGACFHTSALAALENAICELLERDAFLANWYAGQPLPVAVIGRGHPLAAARRRYAKEGWDLRQHLWRHDRAPAWCTMISLVRQRPIPSRWNFFICGGASRDLAVATRKALKEVVGVYHFYHRLADGVRPERMTRAQLTTTRSRVLYYQTPARVQRFLDRLGPEAKAPAARPALAAREFVTRSIAALDDLSIEPLPVPAGMRERVYCIQATCPSLQDVDWYLPAHVNPARLRARYGGSGRLVERLPHPLV